MNLKKVVLSGLALAFSLVSFAQTNSVPDTGTVVIGDSLIIDKSAIVGQDIIINGESRMMDNAVMEKDLEVQGSSTLRGNTIIKDGSLELAYLVDSTLTDDEILLIDSLGIVKRGGDLKSAIYSKEVIAPCPVDINGNIIVANPIWHNAPGILYTSTQCVPDVKVGIGRSNPQAKLHLKVSNLTTKAIIVDGINQQKILQLNPDGLLLTRSIKVDVATWPDYVFDDSYDLMPWKDLKSYISENNHLPNVPTAKQLEADGLNVSETSVMLMEKVEELTLYMIQLQETVERQQKEIEQLKNEQNK
jgi:hypothetical protein